VISRDDIRRCYGTIRPYIRRTPVVRVDLSELGESAAALPVATLKLEQVQCAGSFKARGAFTNLLLREVPPAGVVAASGGNHGVAVAYAARRRGVPAKIFVPTVSAPAKIERIRELGADLVVTGERYADALAAAQDWVNRSAAMSVHAYDQRETILGQGTRSPSPTWTTWFSSMTNPSWPRSGPCGRRSGSPPSRPRRSGSRPCWPARTSRRRASMSRW
jgi:threonine dehydratase